MFGCYGIITCCCKSYHKDTVKFSSNPTISFSRKSTRKDPPVKTDQNKAISVHVLWISFHHRSTPVLSSSHQKINCNEPEGKYYILCPTSTYMFSVRGRPLTHTTHISIRLNRDQPDISHKISEYSSCKLVCGMLILCRRVGFIFAVLVLALVGLGCTIYNYILLYLVFHV